MIISGKTFMKYFTLVLSLFLLWSSVGISNLFAENPDIIKIVSSFPRTGSANAQSTTVVNSIKMAIDEVGGKVGKFSIVYEDWDDASPARGSWDPATEAANADKAVKDPDVMAYIGPYNSGAAKIAMPKLNVAGLVIVSPANTWPGLTKPGIGEPNEPAIYRPTGMINYFRIIVTDDIQGELGAKWAKELGAQKVYILHDGELYGKGIANIFRTTAERLGLTVLGFETVDAKASNYKSLAVKIKQKNPDLVYFGGVTQSNAGQVVKDLRATGVRAQFMVPDGCFEKAFIEASGKENVEGNTFITFGGVGPTQLTGKGRAFFDNYKTRFQSEPEAYAVYGYEAARVVLAAIERAGKKDRRAILSEVAATKDFDGALGRWSFDANGDTSLKVMSGNTIKNGQFVFVKVLG